MNWEELYRIVDLARETDPAERNALVEQECGGDTGLRTMVQDILETNVEAGFLEPPDLLGARHSGKEFGEFLLLEELARGGMGIVYKGIQKEQDRPVAIKVLPLIQRSNPVVFERFQRESNAAARIEHPHAVPILGSGDTRGVAWYAMPLIDGHDLATEVHAQREEDTSPIWTRFSEGPYVGQVVKQVAGVADALQQIHEAGIIHRDIKPRNLLLDREGHLSIVDFGLAKVAELETLTQTDAVQGTPYYMSPEQARTLKHPIDHRTDVYSLCVVLFELLSLKRPFDGDSAEIVLSKISSGTHLDLRKANPRIPRDLVTICEKGMAHDPRHRYDTATDLAKDLNAFLDLKAIKARPRPFLHKAGTHVRRHRMAYLGVAASLLTGVATFGVQDVLASNRSTQGQVDTLQALTQTTPNLAELANAQGLIRTALKERPAGSDLHTLAVQSKELTDSTLQSKVAEIKELFRIGAGGYGDPDKFGAYLAPPSPDHSFRGLQMAENALTFFPDHLELQTLADIDSILPQMQIDLDPSCAQYAGQAIAWRSRRNPYDSSFSEPELLGPLPLSNIATPPGEWRVTVEVPGIGFMEYDRVVIDAGARYSIQARIPTLDSTPKDMVRIALPNQTYHLPEDTGEDSDDQCCHLSDSIHVPDFFIDEAVVSNGEYMDFLEATNTSPPTVWLLAATGELDVADFRYEDLLGDLERDAWRDLPAIGVSLVDAQAYAEFHGKRIPGHYEFEYAARGPERLTVPVPTATNPFLINIGANNRERSIIPRERYHQTNRNLVSVRHPSYKHPPHGLYHTLGNVMQFSWGAPVELIGNHLVYRPRERWNFGASWTRQSDKASLSGHARCDLSPNIINFRIGWRCARSIAPQRPLSRNKIK